jgi:hypothetical protein
MILAGTLGLAVHSQAAEIGETTAAVGGNPEEMRRLSEEAARTAGQRPAPSPALQRLGRDAAGKLEVPASKARSLDKLGKAHQKRTQGLPAARANSPFAEAWEDANGGNVRMAGVENGRILFVGDHSLLQAQQVSTDTLWPGGFAFTDVDGATQPLAFWEITAPRITHEDFDDGSGNSRITIASGQTAGVGNHATNVGGVLLGSGLGFDPLTGDTSIGKSYAATALAFDQFQDTVEMGALALDDFAAHNHSYGLISGWTAANVGLPYLAMYWNSNLSISTAEAYNFGRYDSLAQDTDEAIRATPYTLPVWSAGNDTGESIALYAGIGQTFEVFKNGISQGTGYYFTNVGATTVLHNGTNYWITANGAFSGTLPARFFAPNTANATALAGSPPADGGANLRDSIPDGYGVSKNTLTIGAVDGSNQIAAFSSRGPVDDGRIKPDLVAPGINPLMADGVSDTAYVGQPGTSFSAPAVTGSINLLAEHQKNLWSVDEPLRASSLKALVIHTAQNLGPTGPDYTFGWGIPNFENAAGLITLNSTAQRTYLKEILLANGQEANFTIRTAGGGPVNVTAAWTDPAGTPVAVALDPTTANLVNNLDLRVQRLDANGNVTATYFPWTLNPANPGAAAVRTVTNNRDNVEQVVTVTAASNQIWRVTVKAATGATIFGDDGVTPGTQAVSLALTGITNRNIPFTITSQSYAFGGGNVTATLTWGSHAGNYHVIESSTDLVNWVTSSGVFNARADSTTGVSTPLPASPPRYFRVKTVSPGYVAP